MDKNIKAKINSAEFNKIFNEIIGENHTDISSKLLMNDQYLSELGKIVRNFEVISWNLQQFIIVANDGEFDTMLLSKISFRNTVNLVFKFSKKFEIYNDNVLSILKRELSSAEEIRNLMLHSLWMRGRNENSYITRRKLSPTQMGFLVENFLYTDLLNISNWFTRLITVSENLVRGIRANKKKDVKI